jgi:hypothetical protein
MYNKSAVTSLRINPQLKDLFENTKTLHNKSLSDALEDGLLLTLKNVLPVAILENQIEETRTRLMDLEASLSYAKRIEEETMKKLDKKVEASQSFTGIRETIFSDDTPGSILRQLKRHQNPAWDRVYMKYGFGTAKEMESFVRQEVMKRGIL